jgi:hypothetical protein
MKAIVIEQGFITERSGTFMLPQEQSDDRLRAFLSLRWYEEAIKFVFNFVTKTSELLLAAGVVISTANFLTAGDVMGHSKFLSDAWSWAQALAIDSSLGIVFMNAFQAVREREKIKAVIFFTLTALLTTVAGLITHFDALSHAAGLPVTDKGISGIIPLWVMTALRAVAVIGFLLTSRLKNFSFIALRQEWKHAPEVPQSRAQNTVAPSFDYGALATALVDAMNLSGVLSQIQVVEEEPSPLPSPPQDVVATRVKHAPRSLSEAAHEEPTTTKIAHAYQQLSAERAASGEQKIISARNLAKYASVRRSTCSTWLQQHVIPSHLDHHQEEREQRVDKEGKHFNDFS